MTKKGIAIAVVAVVIGLIGIWLDLENHWTAYSSFTSAISPLTSEETHAHQKTIWNWFELLVVPAAIASSVAILGWMDHKTERRIADDRAQDAALEAYLEQMSKLLLDKELRKSAEGDEVQAVAKAWTLTILRRVKGGRTRVEVVLRFLQESDLNRQEKNIVSLQDADLSKAPLTGVNLTGINLTGVNLTGAHLEGAILIQANLEDAHLDSADLTGAQMHGINLQRAHLFRARLKGAGLTEANLSYANLREANLAGTQLSYAHMDGANLESAILSGATYEHHTSWPAGFDPKAAGAVLSY